MKKTEIILKSLWLGGNKIVTREDVKVICEKYSLNTNKIIHYMLKRKNFITIFRGIYYVKNPDELKFGTTKYSSIEMLSEGLKIKGIKNWYFGLNSAIKMLGVTHEVFVYYYVFNDTFNRKNLMKIYGNEFKFLKIKKDLFSFGLKKLKTKNKIIVKYSDLEKTALDYAYLKKKTGKSDETANSILIEYEEYLNIKKLKKYAKHYPSSVARCLKVFL